MLECSLAHFSSWSRWLPKNYDQEHRLTEQKFLKLVELFPLFSARDEKCWSVFFCKVPSCGGSMTRFPKGKVRFCKHFLVLFFLLFFVRCVFVYLLNNFWIFCFFLISECSFEINFKKKSLVISSWNLTFYFEFIFLVNKNVSKN